MKFTLIHQRNLVLLNCKKKKIFFDLKFWFWKEKQKPTGNWVHHINFPLNFQLTLFILLFVVNCFEATVDLSNLDFSRFRFFRYVQRLPNGEVINTAPPPPSFSDHLARIKAGNFFRLKKKKKKIRGYLNDVFHL